MACLVDRSGRLSGQKWQIEWTEVAYFVDTAENRSADQIYSSCGVVDRPVPSASSGMHSVDCVADMNRQLGWRHGEQVFSRLCVS